MKNRHTVIELGGSTLLVMLACLTLSGGAPAQDIEPRRWTHLPVGANVLGLTYVRTDGDLFFDPVLQIEEATVESNTVVASYSRSFDWSGKTARLDAILPYQLARWDGLLAGSPATREREGLADPWLRLSVDLSGAPALKGKEYRDYRSANPVNTVVGVAVAVMLPLGEYMADKLLNLGQNRFIIRPQAGVTHTRGPWTWELTSSVFFYTDNDNFFGGNKLQQDPLFAFQGHAIYSFPNRWWASLSAGYGWGGESRVNGQAKDDRKSNLLSALSVGVPLGQTQGLRLGYLRGDTQNQVGSRTNSFFLGWTVLF